MEPDLRTRTAQTLPHGNGHGNGRRAPSPPTTPAPGPGPGPGAPHPGLEDAVRQLLAGLGEDPARAGLADTPKRVAHALREMTSGYAEDPARILSRTFDEHHEGMVVVRDIAFDSLCEHHLLPFRGTATVAYLPDGRVVGLSKLSRLVHAFARRLQVQERMTQAVAQAIQDHLGPRGVAVLVRADHTCMGMRGIRSPATTVTTAFLGEFRQGEHRTEFFALAGAGPIAGGR